MEKKTLEYVDSSTVATKYCRTRKQSLKFWEDFSVSSPFTWGDCNRSLVTAEDFADHCQSFLPDTKKSKDFISEIRSLGQTYIDLEN